MKTNCCTTQKQTNKQAKIVQLKISYSTHNFSNGPSLKQHLLPLSSGYISTGQMLSALRLGTFILHRIYCRCLPGFVITFLLSLYAIC